MPLLEENTVIVNEGAVSQIMINRPQSMNAVNLDVFQGIILACDKLSLLKDLRAVTLWGAGDKAFGAGIEVSSLSGLGKRAAAEYFALGQRAVRALETLPVPVLAAVHGYTFGAGLELALACDVIFAAHDTQLGFPEAGLGFVPAFGGLGRLLSRVGPGAAKRLLYTGELMGAEEARGCGLVDKVAAPDRLTEEVNAFADRVARNAPLALRHLKSLFAGELEHQALFLANRAVEVCLELFDSADYEEGLEAFLQKREAAFRGR